MVVIYKYFNDEYVLRCDHCGTRHESNQGDEFPVNIEQVPYEMACRSCDEPLRVRLVNDYSNLEEKGFICTDHDNYQFVKKLSDTEFIVIEDNNEYEIDLNDYSEEQIKYNITAYYSSLEELKEIYGDDSNQIIAECIAEQM
jgi:hypothetical protein